MGAHNLEVPEAIAEAVHDCAEMIEAADLPRIDDSAPAAEPLPSLLEQCMQLTRKAPVESEPIRTVHHFACTGGTLISKCLACMPNTQLLSEVEPHSQVIDVKGMRFAPTDLVHLLRASSRGSDPALETAVFRAGLKVLHGYCSERGWRLVLRDHSHSRYCLGDTVSATPSLREVVGAGFRAVSIVTVRHPLDSFLSLSRLRWLDFEPSTINEYARRYLQFMDDHLDCAYFRYEDFVRDPLGEMQKMCSALQLPFNESFEELFSAVALSGDSGRKGSVIALRERRAMPDGIESELRASVAYAELCERLGYEPYADGDGRW